MTEDFEVPDVLYLAGPMSGVPDNNRPLFDNASLLLARRYGCEVINPHELNKKTVLGGDRSEQAYYMEDDLLTLIERAMGIVLLPGWQKSRGANLELGVALYTELPAFEYIGNGKIRPLQIHDLTVNGVSFAAPSTPPVPEPETILQEAQRLVHGPRQATYGHPLDDFGKTARLWSVILGHPVTEEEVALCMIMLKMSRELNNLETGGDLRDNMVDACGYAETYMLVKEERARRAKVAA